MFAMFAVSGRKGVELQESEQYVMRARGTTLTIRNIKQDDGGSYTCKASNKAGDVQQEIFLKVFGKDSTFFSPHYVLRELYFIMVQEFIAICAVSYTIQ